MRRIAGVVLAFLATAASPAAQIPNAGLTVEVRGEPAQPGSVLAVTVTTASDVERVSGEAFGQRVAFVRGTSPHIWHGLIGVDVAASGSSSLVVLGTTRPLTLSPRQFRTRRLRVASQFVDPSRQEVERIRVEAARLEAICFSPARPS